MGNQKGIVIKITISSVFVFFLFSISSCKKEEDKKQNTSPEIEIVDSSYKCENYKTKL